MTTEKLLSYCLYFGFNSNSTMEPSNDQFIENPIIHFLWRKKRVEKRWREKRIYGIRGNMRCCINSGLFEAK